MLEERLNKPLDEHHRQVVVYVIPLCKDKIKFANISLRGFHKFQAGLGRKKRTKNFHIWF